MKLLKRALRLNNEGVWHLLNERDSEADDCFIQSLSWLKAALSCGALGDNDLAFAEGSASTCTSSMHRATHSIPYLHDPICFIYSNAITFALDDLVVQSCADNFHVCSAVVLLNIGMTYHRRAILSGNSEWRVKAERMYDMVIKLDESDQDPHGTALLTKIAAINNLSQLCHGDGDYESSRDGFTYLGEVLQWAEAQSGTLPSQEDIITEMILNIMLVTAQVNAPSA
jgi:hypothetical protein